MRQNEKRAEDGSEEEDVKGDSEMRESNESKKQQWLIRGTSGEKRGRRGECGREKSGGSQSPENQSQKKGWGRQTFFSSSSTSFYYRRLCERERSP